jgi:quercetin dioxygenase-like cupin family protein
MYARHENDVPPQTLRGRKVKTLLDEGIGCHNLCMGIAIFDTPGRAPGHVHKAEEETIYILNGYGRMHIGDYVEELRPGVAVYIPAQVEHSVENMGNEPIKLVFAFSPPVISGSYPDIIHELAEAGEMPQSPLGESSCQTSNQSRFR